MKILRPLERRSIKDMASMSDEDKKVYIEKLFNEDHGLNIYLKSTSEEIKKLKAQLIEDSKMAKEGSMMWNKMV